MKSSNHHGESGGIKNALFECKDRPAADRLRFRNRVISCCLLDSGAGQSGQHGLQPSDYGHHDQIAAVLHSQTEKPNVPRSHHESVVLDPVGRLVSHRMKDQSFVEKADRLIAAIISSFAPRCR